MAVLSSSLLWKCLLVCVLVSFAEGQEILTAQPGDSVTLPCKVPSNMSVLAVLWTRPDLKSEYVFFYRDAQSDSDKQHPAFINRVELKDKQMKDGDVSLVMTDVMINDSGTYECRVVHRRIERRKRSVWDTEPISSINVNVQPSVDSRGHVGLIVGLVAAVGLVTAVVIFMKCKRQTGSSELRPADEAGVNMLNMAPLNSTHLCHQVIHSETV
ncbi:coxsackievirus and adenovirus receptor-like [Channa argus]|uniref:coxsackievirus and adenovirus receptor-like n=1 Tax=Channa argus TaxID=215402 RepID=UPI00352123A9